MAKTQVKTTLSAKDTKALIEPLDLANRAFANAYPGEPTLRQPVHTVYGGAHLFQFDSAKKMGALALASLDEYAPDFVSLARALKWPGSERLPQAAASRATLERALAESNEVVKTELPEAWLAHTVYQRVRTKLQHEAVEDFRLDYEDGYGIRQDAEEDRDAKRGAKELARGLKKGTLPPFIGVRVKALTPELRTRSLRTLDVFLTALVAETKGALPPNFVVTLPKVQHLEQVSATVRALELLERKLKLAPGAVKLELMVELTQTLIDSNGEVHLPQLVRAAKGRCRGAHFGTYDYTASCDIAGPYQRMTHSACDFARHVMQVCLARTGVFLSDGATNVMPIGPHRAKEGALTPEQRIENREVVHRAWGLAATHIRDSLERGFYQGWDLHPAQLPVRYATTYYAFFEALENSSKRLKNFVEKAAQATRVGAHFDDAATGQGLVNFFLRGRACGAFSEAELTAQTGLPSELLATRSFERIVAEASNR